MVMNEANKSVKTTVTTTTPASLNQQQQTISKKTDTEKQNIFAQRVNPQQKSTDIDENSKPLSKIDIIKKFDNKFKTEKNDEPSPKIQPPIARVAPASVIKTEKLLIDDSLDNNLEMLDNRKSKNIFDDEKPNEEKPLKESNDDNNGHSDSEEQQDSLEHRSSWNSNNFYKNGSSDSGTNVVNSSVGVIPPKPMPRTSRNNSISSDQGSVVFGSDDFADKINRPVAKPRTTNSYKVLFYLAYSTLKQLFF